MSWGGRLRAILAELKSKKSIDARYAKSVVSVVSDIQSNSDLARISSTLLINATWVTFALHYNLRLRFIIAVS